MSYDKIGIINLALTRIGVKRLADLSENTPQRHDAISAWDYIRDEVLEAKDWRFAKTRATLGTGGEGLDESYHYDYAYQLPPDFLRLVGNTTEVDNITDPPVYPPDYPYIVEVITVTAGDPPTTYDTKCLLIDYDNTDSGLFINYIKRQEDVSVYSASFVNAFAFRLAAELCINRTEGAQKYQTMIKLYEIALGKAESHNLSMDYVEEVQSKAWFDAGRG